VLAAGLALVVFRHVRAVRVGGLRVGG